MKDNVSFGKWGLEMPVTSVKVQDKLWLYIKGSRQKGRFIQSAWPRRGGSSPQAWRNLIVKIVAQLCAFQNNDEMTKCMCVCVSFPKMYSPKVYFLEVYFLTNFSANMDSGKGPFHFLWPWEVNFSESSEVFQNWGATLNFGKPSHCGLMVFFNNDAANISNELHHMVFQNWGAPRYVALTKTPEVRSAKRKPREDRQNHRKELLSELTTGTEHRLVVA